MIFGCVLDINNYLFMAETLNVFWVLSVHHETLYYDRAIK